MKNHKSILKIGVFLVLVGAICVVILLLNTNNLQENIKSKLNAKENVSNLSNTLNFSQDKNNTFIYQEIMNKGYCGDGICNRENKENEETCCEDCGCKGNFSCKYGFCVIFNYSQNYLFYPDYNLNFSLEIPKEWIISKHKNGIAFSGSKNTDVSFNVISINVLPAYPNKTIHDASIEMSIVRKIKSIYYENITLGNIDAEKTISLHPYGDNELKKINIIAKKGDYFYSLSYTSLTEYLNLIIDEFNHTANTFKFIDGEEVSVQQ